LYFLLAACAEDAIAVSPREPAATATLEKKLRRERPKD